MDPASQSSTAASSFTFPPLSQDSTTAALADPHAPELFKHNIQLAMEQVARIVVFARNAITGVQNAYQAEVNPAQVRADLMALDQAMHALAELLRVSGVGACPLPAEDDITGAPTEQTLIADTTRDVQKLYETMQRMQEGSAVVANLLAASDNVARSKP